MNIIQEIEKEEQVYPFEFSVIMAVYNVELYLYEAVDSLLAQDFGFEEHVQLILVDDGSTDGSGRICDEYQEKYPDNIKVIHKENGGVASARNEGLRYADGHYLNFMDSDDKLTKNVFSKVYKFFLHHEDEIDIVTIPLVFFEGKTGGHWQNYKFKKGNRIADLYQDYQAIFMSASASFFTSSCKHNIYFDDKLVCGEDTKVILSVIWEKMKVGLVTGCKYLYRRRVQGERSRIQSSTKEYGWYFDYFTYLVDWAIDFYENRFGYLPAFVQYELIADLQWRFNTTYDMEGVLNEIEINEYKKRLFDSLKRFDDKYILEQKKIYREQKCFMLSKKYDHAPEITGRNKHALVHFGNTIVCNMASDYSRIDFMNYKEGKFSIEGYSKFVGIDENEKVELYILVNNEEYIICDIIERKEINEYCLDELMFRGIAFRCEILLDESIEVYNFQLVAKLRNIEIRKTELRFGRFTPIQKKYKKAYYYSDGRVFTSDSKKITGCKCGRKGYVKREMAFLKELRSTKTKSDRKAVIARILCHIIKPFLHKDIWLISDRIDKADDNGEAFFKYLQQHPDVEIKSYFCISKDSNDFKRMKQYGKVIPFLGWRYKLYTLLGAKIISSQAEEYIFRPFQSYSAPFSDWIHNQKFVFLQHGVIKDDLSNWLNRYNKNIYLFVTATNSEYESILSCDYYYSTQQVVLSGLPRYDYLYHNEKRLITIMPTWRAYLVTGIDAKTGERQSIDDGEEHGYYQMYKMLLNDVRLIVAAKQYGYTLQFKCHPNMICTLEKLAISKEIKLLTSEESYQKIFAESDLLVTDYSSIAFDFAYLRKPVLYFQADIEDFFSGKHTYEKGYFDYEKDGFGEVEYDVESLVNRIIEYMANECRLKEKYRERIDAAFPFDDRNNCERVYRSIKERLKS